MARHFEARPPQRGDDIGTVAHHSVLDAVEQVVPDQVARGGFEPGPGSQLRCLDVGAVSGLLHSGSVRIVGTAPAVLVVEGVAERIERLLPARRGNVQAPPGFKVAPSREDVDVGTATSLAVQYRRPCVPVGLQPRPGRLLEGVQNRLDLLVGGAVVRRPGDHAGRVPVLEVEGVGHRGHHFRVPPQDFDALARLPGRVPLPEEVVGRSPGRPGPVREKLNVHRDPGSRSGPAP
ncbi:MAG: hypothetical protein OXU74_07265 [Gemmatimonadota bacterium]|nr:hypothetical protein [Gemmatimonadota bacterium]